MILPADTTERHRAFRNMIRSCEMNSRVSRKTEADYLARWGEQGGDQAAEYNMLGQMINTSTAYLIDPQMIRFEVGLPKKYGGLFTDEEDAARDDLHEGWHNHGDGLVVVQAVKYAHMWPSVFAKVYGRGDDIQIGMLSDPSDFGTAHEDLDSLDELPYFTHWYTLTISQFERRVAGHPKYKQVMRVVLDHATAPDRMASQNLPPTLLISASNPTMIGAVAQMPEPRGEAVVREPVVKLAELWWFDSEIADWRMATEFIPTLEILWEAVDNPLQIKGEHPFAQLCLEPKPGYLYGRSRLTQIIPLQRRREDVLAKVYRVNDRQLDPALIFDGFPGLIEEKAERIVADGGLLASPMPGARVTPVFPQMPPDVWSLVNMIDQMAARAWGLPQSSHGEAQPNARSGGQESELAALGSPTLRGLSAIVTSFIETIATKKLRMRQRELATPLKKAIATGEADDTATVGGTEFYLSQMPDELYVRVWGHSASPIGAAANERKADKLIAHGAIGGETYAEMLDAPFPEKVAKEARKLAAAASKYKGMLLQIKEREAKAKEYKATK